MDSTKKQTKKLSSLALVVLFGLLASLLAVVILLLQSAQAFFQLDLPRFNLASLTPQQVSLDLENLVHWVERNVYTQLFNQQPSASLSVTPVLTHYPESTISAQPTTPTPTVTTEVARPTQTVKTQHKQITCYRVTIDEPEFASNQCYTSQDASNLRYYLARWHDAVSREEFELYSMKITCDGSDFFKDSCEQDKQDLAAAHQAKDVYTSHVRMFISRGW